MRKILLLATMLFFLFLPAYSTSQNLISQQPQKQEQKINKKIKKQKVKENPIIAEAIYYYPQMVDIPFVWAMTCEPIYMDKVTEANLYSCPEMKNVSWIKNDDGVRGLFNTEKRCLKFKDILLNAVIAGAKSIPANLALYQLWSQVCDFPENWKLFKDENYANFEL